MTAAGPAETSSRTSKQFDERNFINFKHRAPRDLLQGRLLRRFRGNETNESASVIHFIAVAFPSFYRRTLERRTTEYSAVRLKCSWLNRLSVLLFPHTNADTRVELLRINVWRRRLDAMPKSVGIGCKEVVDSPV